MNCFTITCHSLSVTLAVSSLPLTQPSQITITNSHYWGPLAWNPSEYQSPLSESQLLTTQPNLLSLSTNEMHSRLVGGSQYFLGRQEREAEWWLTSQRQCWNLRRGMSWWRPLCAATGYKCHSLYMGAPDTRGPGCHTLAGKQLLWLLLWRGDSQGGKFPKQRKVVQIPLKLPKGWTIVSDYWKKIKPEHIFSSTYCFFFSGSEHKKQTEFLQIRVRWQSMNAFRKKANFIFHHVLKDTGLIQLFSLLVYIINI